MGENKYVIQGATLVNEGRLINDSLWIANGRIIAIGDSWIDDVANAFSKSFDPDHFEVIDGRNKHVLPGLIDDQVHFREPGLTHKTTIESASKAAVAGGITSFIEMPNTNPQTTTIHALDDKFARAHAGSYANYSFMFGGTNDNLEVIKTLDPQKVAALKLFLGSSTGNMLVDDLEVLENIFRSSPVLIAVHCEDEQTVQSNLNVQRSKYGDAIPIEMHPTIRSEEACYRSSSRAVALAKKTGARLHVFHVSTQKELSLFSNSIPLEDKKITAEVCVHHLWFSDEDYAKKGSFIKWNPAIKKATDREALWSALLDDRIDVIATDHAPHTLEEKQQPYVHAPSGGPLVQHALPALLECYRLGKISLPKIVEKMCHNPAKLFQIHQRGYLRPGYHADLVLVDLNAPWEVTQENILYPCGWSPFDGEQFASKLTHTMVNGQWIIVDGVFTGIRNSQQLHFDRK